MTPTKSQLRRELKRARLALSPEERQAKSTAIVGRLWSAVDWSSVASVHCYQPILRLGEVDVADFVMALAAEYPGIWLFTPRQIGGEWQVVALKGGRPATAPPEFDIIIVPMLGFDASRQRLGYGAGYYDRLLAAQPQARTIGLCYDLGQLPNLPTEPHDMALDTIITETQKLDG